MTRFFALTTRGLEGISAEEIAALPGVVVTEQAYRRVTGHCTDAAALLRLRTVDDVYLEAARWDGLTHTRAALVDLCDRAARLDLHEARIICAGLRPVGQPPVFSVTASFVGKRNYSSDEIKTAVAGGVTARYGWNYMADERDSDLNMRVFIEHDAGLVGVRLGARPLHERGYKQQQRPGSLKPPVAAAMLRLAGVEAGTTLLDPCCGAGTILIEGAALGAEAQGGDHDSEAVASARANAGSAGVKISLDTWDARKLPVADASIDRIVTNLPWGRQIMVDDDLTDIYHVVCAEMLRVLKPGGRIVTLTGSPDRLRFDELKPEKTLEISLFGQRPVISVFAG